MHRFSLVLLVSFFGLCAWGQTSSQPVPTSDPQAVTLAQRSILSITRGLPISDVTLKANVISIIGGDYDTGTARFSVKGTGESRVDLNLNSGGPRFDVRNQANGAPGGAWQRKGNSPAAYAQHNCWTDAAWFFPGLGSLSQTANPGFIFSYMGQIQHGSVSTQHIRVYQWSANSPIPALSTMDFYLDPVSFLPVAVAFNTHADNDMATNIATEIDFASYQAVSGIEVPFHFQKIFNGRVILDATVTSAAFNNGLQDSLFTLQ